LTKGKRQISLFGSETLIDDKESLSVGDVLLLSISNNGQGKAQVPSKNAKNSVQRPRKTYSKTLLTAILIGLITEKSLIIIGLL
jgi:hypothetical protein